MQIKLPASLTGSAGHIGQIWFDESGVSEQISAETARRFLAVFGGEVITPLPEGVATLDQWIVQERNELAEVFAAQEQERMRFRKDLEEHPAQAAKMQPKQEGEHTRESLAALADKGGIKPLREIGDKLGVKAQSIGKLIDEILEAQEAASKVE